MTGAEARDCGLGLADESAVSFGLGVHFLRSGVACGEADGGGAVGDKAANGSGSA